MKQNAEIKQTDKSMELEIRLPEEKFAKMSLYVCRVCESKAAWLAPDSSGWGNLDYICDECAKEAEC